MRKLVLLAAAAASVLASCGQASQAPGANAPAGASAAAPSVSNIFPDLTRASFRAEAVLVRPGEAQGQPMVMIRSGRRMRMEMAREGGSSVIITNAETREGLILTQAAGRTMAMRVPMDSERVRGATDLWETAAEGAQFVGPCTGAGQAGAQWRTTREGEERTMCVTPDGIILSATQNGVETWRTTSIQRGPQADSLFELPPGVQVMDLGAINPAVAAAMERARQAQQR